MTTLSFQKADQTLLCILLHFSSKNGIICSRPSQNLLAVLKMMKRCDDEPLNNSVTGKRRKECLARWCNLELNWIFKLNCYDWWRICNYLLVYIYARKFAFLENLKKSILWKSGILSFDIFYNWLIGMKIGIV